VAFGPYIITRRIARGGMAEIYRARTRATGADVARWVAVKMMRSSLGHEELRLRLFDREARIASRLAHDNVVPVYEYGQEMGRPFLAMEYVRGRDLSHLLKNEKKGRELVPFELGLYVGHMAARGLGHAHRATDEESGQSLGIVHRDMSPGNVMVGYDGGVKVLDFGVARMNETQGFHTQTGTLRGKFAYMSPEQTLGEDLDARSDVFSLGTVLYELLTGINCFRANSPIATLERVQGLRPVPPSRANRAIPKEVDKVLARCLAKDRRRRFADGTSLAEAIGEFLDKIRYDGRAAMAAHMEAEFAWEKHEEESELSREEDEVALFDVVDFALLSNTSELDAKNVAVSTEEEASQAQVESMARRSDPAASGVFEGEHADISVELAPVGVEDEDDATVAQPLPFEDEVHKAGERVEVASLLAPPERTSRIQALATDLALPAGVPELTPDAAEAPLTARLGPTTRATALDTAPPPVAPRRRGGLVWAAAALLVVGGGVAAWAAARGGDAEPRTTLVAPVTITLEPGPAPAPRGRAAPAPAPAPAPVPVVPDEVAVARPDEAPEELLPEGDGHPPLVLPGQAPDEVEDPDEPQDALPVRTVLKEVRPRVGPKVAPRPKRVRPPKKAPTGFLNVGAKPWAEIQIDGKPWPYQTPQAGIELRAGKHSVTLHNPETGVTKTTAVYIKSGAYRTVMMDMRKR
jgi:serine/threonine protein kinase